MTNNSDSFDAAGETTSRNSAQGRSMKAWKTDRNLHRVIFSISLFQHVLLNTNLKANFTEFFQILIGYECPKGINIQKKKKNQSKTKKEEGRITTLTPFLIDDAGIYLHLLIVSWRSDAETRNYTTTDSTLSNSFYC